jgi:hypothetical protein
MKTRIFLVALLSTGLLISSNAQDMRPEQGPTTTYQLVDANLIKVTSPSGNYFHVTPEGIREGAFLLHESIDADNALSVQGQMNQGKYIGRVIYRLNGEIAMIRVYDEVGTLVKTTRMHDVSWGATLAQN